jgi:glycosyltransferase involved in cell wall biosynthesis
MMQMNCLAATESREPCSASPEGRDASPSERGRVLIFIVAYQAEKHLESVLDQVPPNLFNNERIHFLIIDDASSDAGVEAAHQWARRRQIRNITILRNPVNQGYGGNQKLGYRIAIEAGFDFVILLHGDGQYSPALLPRFIEIWRRTDADVVLGSRMQDLASARRGGMPWHKLIGNRMLTMFQNAMTGRTLSEYHTGYRGYSTRFLRRVPFELNTNDFHFDTELLLQAMHVNARFEEFAIPTRYGDEICRVNGPRYAKNVIAATTQFKMHQMGMLCSMRYRNLEPTRYQDKTIMAYSSHALALEMISRLRPRTVLDIGCGPGFIATKCEEQGIRVTGVDAFEPLPGMMSRFSLADLEREPLPEDPSEYDMVLLLDVIEHLQDPEMFLLDLRNRSQGRPQRDKPFTLLLSTPNIAFAAIRLNLLLGRFTYAERGILDITHKRLFTRSSLLRMLRDCGYVVEKVVPAGVPFQAVMPGRMGRMLGSIAGVMASIWPTMFAFQFIVRCRPLPGVRQLLARSERHLVSQAEMARVLDETGALTTTGPGSPHT